jgi:uncharacterized protein
VTVALVVAIGFAAGIVAGLFGVGGGVLFVPALALGLGLTQVHAEATSLLAILPTALAGSWRQLRYGNVEVRPAAWIGVAAVGGVQLGVLVAHSLPEATLRRLFGALVLLVAAQLVWQIRRS